MSAQDSRLIEEAAALTCRQKNVCHGGSGSTFNQSSKGTPPAINCCSQMWSTRKRAVPLGREVRLGHGLAELLGAGLIRRRGAPRRLQPLHAPDRGDVRVVRLAPGARLRRRPPANRPPVLHKFVLARPGAPRPLGVVPTKVADTKRASSTVWGLRTQRSDTARVNLGRIAQSDPLKPRPPQSWSSRRSFGSSSPSRSERSS